jgi:hypothetical protein
MTSSFSHEEFPDEIWQEIFTFLEPTELLIVNLVSKKFKKLEEKTWKYMVPTIPSFSLFDEKNYYFKILNLQNSKQNMKVLFPNLFMKNLWIYKFVKLSLFQNYFVKFSFKKTPKH